MANIGIKKFLNIINPEPEIGGLEISDAYLRFVSLKGKKATFASLKLPPKVVEDGVVKDKGQLQSILLDFYKRIGGKKKKIYIIAVISDGSVYTELFSLPRSAKSNLAEATKLNLQMISPINFNSAYYDWQLVGERLVDASSQLDILGAFAAKQTINDFNEILTATGFDVVAFEFPAVSLARTLIQLGEGISKDKNYLVMKVGSSGLSFGLIKNGNLYFIHFSSWSSAYGQERQVSFESLKKLIINESQKVLSFYEAQWGGSVDDMLLITPTLSDEILKIISSNFPRIAVQLPVLRQFRTISPDWLSVIGAALRGLIPRAQDDLISLAPTGTEEKLKEYQIAKFVEIWRNVILTVLGAILIFFGVLDFALMKNSAVLDEKLQGITAKPESAQIMKFQKEARDFNQKADLIYAAYKLRTKWSPFFQNIIQLASPDIYTGRILIQSLSSPVLLNGEADSAEKVINFKNVLLSQPQYSDVNLPLSNIVRQPSGRFSFGINFRIKDLNLIPEPPQVISTSVIAPVATSTSTKKK